MHRKIFTKLAEKQIQGIKFHSDMADYYAFLNLDMFREFHDKQYIEESKMLRKIKKYFIHKYHETLLTDEVEYIANITPKEWCNKTSMDVDESAIKVLLKQSLDTYCKWEKEVAMMFNKCADELFEDGHYDDYRFVKHLADEVEAEVSHVKCLAIDLQSVGYNINAIKGLQYKLEI